MPAASEKTHKRAAGLMRRLSEMMQRMVDSSGTGETRFIMVWRDGQLTDIKEQFSTSLPVDGDLSESPLT